MEENQKTHWRKCDKSEFLGAADLDEMHGDLEAIISHVTIELVNPNGREEKLKRVAYFKGETKKMIVNVINGKKLKKRTGSKYVEDWNNIPVSIYIESDVKRGKEITEGIRFRDFQPPLKKEKLTKNHPRFSNAIAALREGNTTIEAIQEHFELSNEIKKQLDDAANLS